jgi:hypothetical protein
MGKNRQTAQAPESVDLTSDRHPKLEKVLAAIDADPELETLTVERIEIYANAGGDASVRVWTPRAEEPSVGYYTPDQLQ